MIKSSWLKSAGRGPTKLMSPFKILQIWGSSSRLVLRRKPPMGVSHALGSDSKCVATVGASIRIVRNLGIVNITLLRPIRADQYNAGPREVIRTSTAITKSGRRHKAPAKHANRMSDTRFIHYTLRKIGITTTHRCCRSEEHTSELQSPL